MSEALMNGAVDTYHATPTLKSLVQDFISMTLIVRRGRDVISVDVFEARVNDFFATLEQEARRASYSVDQVKDTQYALCAFLDESILRTDTEGELRRHFEMSSLQFRYFGVHLAGQGFFEKIDTLRADVKHNLDVLEVYHLCLALGFEGKFAKDDKDQLRYLANTLGQDIARYRKTPQHLFPSSGLPDQVSHVLRIPLWFYLMLMVMSCLGVYLTLDWLLDKDVTALSEHISTLFSA